MHTKYSENGNALAMLSPLSSVITNLISVNDTLHLSAVYRRSLLSQPHPRTGLYKNTITAQNGKSVPSFQFNSN